MPSPDRVLLARWNDARALVHRPAAGSALFACALLLVATPVRAGDIFTTPHAYAAGGHPTSVVAGDVNGDGRTDLVVANEGGNTLSIFLADGSGGFQPRRDLVVQPHPSSLLMCNLDGDGIPDLLVAYSGSGWIEAMLGSGDGEFFPLNLVWTLGVRGGIVTADFDGNGALDVAAAVQDQNAVVVILRSADPDSAWWLGEPDYFGAGRRPVSIAAGDVDGDGHPDIVAADSAGRTVAVLHGRGDGTFDAPVTYGTVGRPLAIGIGDMNEDGYLDLVATCDSACFASVFPGRGDGTFASRQDVQFGGDELSMHSLVLGDLDADGHLDIAVACYHYMVMPIRWDARVVVAYGAGDGTIAHGDAVTFVGVTEPTGEPLSIAACDLNGDGRTDLIGTFCTYPCATAPGAVFEVEQSRNRAFGAGHLAPGGLVAALALADFDGNGRLDLVTASEDPDGATVFPGLGGGRFGPGVRYATGTEPTGVAAGDLDGDGHADFVVACYGSGAVTVWMGAAGAVCGRAHDVPCGPHPTHPVLADLDGDGVLDLVLANLGDTTLSVLRGTGDGMFGPRTTVRTSARYTDALCVRDLNADGVLDLVIGGEDTNNPGLTVMLGDGAGGFVAREQDWSGHRVPSLDVADFDEDGHPDIALTDGSTLTILRGRGDGTFGERSDWPVACYGIEGIVAGDLDGDGHVDIALAGDPGWCDGLTVKLGDGHGLFREGGVYWLECPGFDLALADLDGDHAPDLVVAGGRWGAYVLSNALGHGTAGVATGSGTGATRLALAPPWPNPSRGSCEIRFVLPAPASVDVGVYDLAGRRVRSLLAGRHCVAGELRLAWDGIDASGARVPAGMYFVRVSTPAGTVGHRVVRLP